MTPALTAILDAIEAGTVRIRWAHDDEHALTEAQAMAADVRALLVLLADQAHMEADPDPDIQAMSSVAAEYSVVASGPRYLTFTSDDGREVGPVSLDIIADALEAFAARADSVTLPDPYEVAERMAGETRDELARRCGLVADTKGRDEDEWAYLVEDTGAVRIAHTSWWDRNRDEKRAPGWAIFEDWRHFDTIDAALRVYAADHTLPRNGDRITGRAP